MTETDQELEAIRDRFNAAQRSVTAFAHWLCTYLHSDFYTLFGMVDGLRMEREEGGEGAQGEES